MPVFATRRTIPAATRLAPVLAALLACQVAVPAGAQQLPVALRDSFPVGSQVDAICQAQSIGSDPALAGPFDRGWAIACRDSALPVGHVFLLRGSADDVARRLEQRRAATVDCAVGGQAVQGMPLLAGNAEQRGCRWRDPALDYAVASMPHGRGILVAEGFAAYGSAVALAARSVVEDRVVPGEVAIATTSLGDSAAFARLQALTLDPKKALGEGYRRNNSGDYADAAEFFETLQQRLDNGTRGDIDPVEFMVNRALQKSNLGEFTEADALFAEVRARRPADPLLQRLVRNFEAIHRINQQRPDAALARLREPIDELAQGTEAMAQRLEITPAVASRINASDEVAASGLVDTDQLTARERAVILDAQAQHLAATAQRLLGQHSSAQTTLEEALARIVAIRDGRVVSIIRLRAQITAELARVAEAQGDMDRARSLLQSAVDLISLQYPETRALAAARARLAAFEARQGRIEEALTLYRNVVSASLQRDQSITGLANNIEPYFALLVERAARDPGAAADLFAASQLLVRPGVAETQAMLARELSAGNDEAARRFRQSVSLTRSIERSRIRLAALSRVPSPTAEDAAARDALAEEIASLEAQQQATLVRLADVPQYRAVAPRSLSLAELQATLGEGETYARLSAVAGRLYMIAATRDRSAVWRVPMSVGDLEADVDAIRDTISRFEDGEYVTEPFDIKRARKLYLALFGPAEEMLAGTRHLVFEGDGAMLRLPANLLVADDESVARYEAAQQRGGDPFDMRGIAWMGRARMISTAVSPRAFADARAAPSSRAARPYLGLGENAVAFGEASRASTRGGSAMGERCDWPLTEWNRPISSAELLQASQRLGPQASEVITGAAFADDRIVARSDLDEYRIVHFATHGLVTPPRPECPARPALLTSFGGAGSDGLLSFQEIFDLRLDADLVILSACDTAGRADVAVTREAGLATGGGTALDGLVRSFIGAGGRSVLASHWPAPDAFDATGRLIGGLFDAAPGEAMGAALVRAQNRLMDEADTSHPFYWAGFALVGDAARALVPAGGAGATPLAALGPR